VKSVDCMSDGYLHIVSAINKSDIFGFFLFTWCRLTWSIHAWPLFPGLLWNL